jgi:hypothetical protein
MRASSPPGSYRSPGLRFNAASPTPQRPYTLLRASVHHPAPRRFHGAPPALSEPIALGEAKFMLDLRLIVEFDFEVLACSE